MRLGQIDSAGRNKLRAQVDEYYLSRVSEGLTANAEVNGRTYRMRVSKIYPQVRNGTFEIDLQFVGEEPRELQRGQTVQLRMTLGASSQARLVPNGAFYNDTGGNWIFVVSADGRSAVRRQVRLGRRNAEFHRGARRAGARRARHHLPLYRLPGAGPAEPVRPVRMKWAKKGRSYVEHA